MKNPTPISSLTVNELTSTLKKSYSASKRESITNPDIIAKLDALSKHSTGGKYCAFLKAGKQLDSCDDPPKRQPILPKPKIEFET